jgi:hypothetical protein
MQVLPWRSVVALSVLGKGCIKFVKTAVAHRPEMLLSGWTGTKAITYLNRRIIAMLSLSVLNKGMKSWRGCTVLHCHKMTQQRPCSQARRAEEPGVYGSTIGLVFRPHRAF